MVAVVAAETALCVEVADVVRVRLPDGLHLGNVKVWKTRCTSATADLIESPRPA